MAYIKKNLHNQFIKLTEYDEYTPKEYIGTYVLFSNEKNGGIYVKTQLLKSIREKTFQEAYRLYSLYKPPSFVDFFNYNIDYLSELGYNHFMRIDKFSPIANLIECFSNMENGYSYISFGVSRSKIKEYLYLKKQGKDIPKSLTHSELYNRGDSDKYRYKVTFGYETFVTSKLEQIDIVDSAVYKRFKEWCSINEISVENAILMGMDLIMESFPSKQLKELEEYDLYSDFDKLLLDDTIRKEDVDCSVKVNGTLFSISDKIIKRMNRDPKNIYNQIDFNTYLNNALYLLNRNVDLKYRNIDLYTKNERYKKMKYENHKI